MKKKYHHAMTIRMTNEVMTMIEEKSKSLGTSKNQIVQIILKEVANSYGQTEKEER